MARGRSRSDTIAYEDEITDRTRRREPGATVAGFVAGIGGGALMKLNQAGVRVFQAAGPTIQDNINALTGKGLAEFTMQHTCQGHGGGCDH